jgi:intracellular sulfur oxidation DsrE/DsrF family protein
MKNRNVVSPFTRRSFFGSLGLTSLAVIPQILIPSKASAVAGVSEPLSDNDVDGWFKKIKGQHRIVYDATTIHEGFSIIWSWVFLDANNETGSTDDDLTTMVVFRHNAFALALSDEIWSSYKLGKLLKIFHPSTGVPATKNPYWDPPNGVMPELGMSIKMLSQRGAMFCVCERSLTVNSRIIAKSKGMDAEEVKKEWTAGLLPGVQIVPAGVWAISRAQELGCSYCFAG